LDDAMTAFLVAADAIIVGLCAATHTALLFFVSFTTAASRGYTVRHTC
jgi:hypothetical protein